MFGSSPVATYPYGRVEYPAGLFLVSLGQATAGVSGFTATTLSKVSLGQGSATATSLDASNYITIPLGQGSANAQALDAVSKLLSQLGIADSSAVALSFSGQRIGLFSATTDAQGQDGQFVVYLDLGVSGANSEANLIIPKHIAQMVFAHAIASGELLENLQIRLKIGRADSTAIALDSIPLSKLDMGQALADAQALNISGLGLGLFRVDATAQGIAMGMKLSTGSAGATIEGLDVVTLSKPLLENAGAIADALNITEQDLILIIEDATARALDGDITYLVSGVPEIVVTRSATSATLKVLNQNQNNLRIFRADDHRGQFSVIASNHDDSTDYVDSGLDQTKNYKYVAAFVIVGEKGGEEFIVTGQRCLPVYTIGNQIL